jgi:HD-GYP domain-containing protein (c-di-GMP phosphodiesterase class II)
MAVQRISVDDVEIGMYVSSLDRPWRETPFLFQGFLIRAQEEVDQLKNLCRHVFILLPDEEIVISGGLSRGPVEPLPEDVLGRKRYAITRDADDEVRTVRKSHAKLVSLLKDVETMLKERNQLDLPVIEESVNVMVESIERNPDAYLWLTKLRKFGSYIYRDALNSSVLATAVGRELGLERDKLKALATGAMFMDIGKTALPAELLNKPGRLTNDEWTLMKTHVEHGLRIFGETPDVANDVLDIVRTHHERLDGSGYHAGLAGTGIPLLGQIAGIVDFYVSITTPRPYAQQPVSPSNAAYMLFRQQGRHFSEDLVRSFIQAIGTYPTGSLVDLSSGETAVVTSQNPGLRLKPNVALLLDPNKRPYGAYPVVSLVNYSYQNRNEPVTIKRTLAAGQYGIKVEELPL